MVFVIKSTTQKRIAQDHRKEIRDEDHVTDLLTFKTKKITFHNKCRVASFIEKDYLSQY